MDATSRNQASGAPRIGAERLLVSGSELLLIDQFMLGNDHFLQSFLNSEEEPVTSSTGDYTALRDAAAAFGGTSFAFPAGEYAVLRDPARFVIAICEANRGEDRVVLDEVLRDTHQFQKVGRVFIDTRCLAILDAELLWDKHLRARYCGLRRRGAEKPARDLLREHGGAVRYGFESYGDELVVARHPTEKVVALWPDVTD